MDEELRAELLARADEDQRAAPIEDPENLDARRAAVGLGSFADYEAVMRRGEC